LPKNFIYQKHYDLGQSPPVCFAPTDGALVVIAFSITIHEQPQSNHAAIYNIFAVFGGF
jgi:hypothetical protein